MSVLVTGGAGYIGSHAAHQLVDAGEDVVVLDDLSTGVRENVPGEAVFVEGDVGDAGRVEELVARAGVEAVMHFAGSIVVPESVEQPLAYYENNTCKTRTLLEACVEQGVESFIFSSTAAVYGEPEEVPVDEGTPTEPINPYGASKLMIEWMLRDVARAREGFEYVALRYFNVAGADPQGRTGQSTPDATHLIKVASQAAAGKREYIEIYGTDYPTPDGTGVRDYIHVTDLADAHLAALSYLREGGASEVMNCGYGRGFSVREVIEAVKAVSGVDFEVREAARRAGDPAALVSDPSKLRETVDWEPAHGELEEIVGTALKWEGIRGEG